MLLVCFLNLPFPTNSPFILVFTFNVLERHLPTTTHVTRAGAVGIFIAFTFVTLFILFYWGFTAFGPFHRHHFHPVWSSSRLTLFLELHPILGFFIPITSFLRGLVLTASVRWLLNFAAFTMIAMGEGLLKPAYLKACCYGKDFLTGNEHGECTSLPQYVFFLKFFFA